MNPALQESVAARIAALKAADAEAGTPVPVDLVTASGSGLDPHLSPAAVYYQAKRVAKERGMAPEAVNKLIEQHIEAPDMELFGQARINVLKLNLVLDKLAASPMTK